MHLRFGAEKLELQNRMLNTLSVQLAIVQIQPHHSR